MCKRPIIYATSDLHGWLPNPKEIPPCDVFLIAGDVTPVTNHGAIFQLDWLHRAFKPWLEQISAKRVCMTPGNHDFIFQDQGPVSPLNATRSIIASLPCHVLIDRAITVDGVTIYGTPWTPTFGRWAFMRDEEDLETIFGEIPSGIDILMSHGPPRGYCDRTQYGQSVGSLALTKTLNAVTPQAVVCGHIHEGYGLRTMQTGVRPIQVYNVSHVNFDYRPVNSVVQVELA